MEENKNPQNKGAFNLGNINLGNKQKNMNNNDPNNQYNSLSNGQAVIKEGATVAQPPVEQVQPTQPPVEQEQFTQPVAQAQPTQQPTQQPAQQQVAQEQFTDTAQSAQSSVFVPGSTYFKSGNERDGFIEIDLNFSRFRGEENRYLSIGLSGFDVGADNNPIPTQSSISITNEEDFNNFKEFVKNLNWND